jgi:hypothetical protein
MAEPDDHAFMTGCRLGAIGSQETIPPGQIEPEIAVGFPDDHRVVYPVHLGRNHKKPQDTIHKSRQANIAVIK